MKRFKLVIGSTEVKEQIDMSKIKDIQTLHKVYKKYGYTEIKNYKENGHIVSEVINTKLSHYDLSQAKLVKATKADKEEHKRRIAEAIKKGKQKKEQKEIKKNAKEAN